MKTALERFSKIPVTISLIFINALAFLYCWIQAGTFKNPEWGIYLLKSGSLFNPFVAGGEWYRIMTSMFMHGNIVHLALNMYGLFVVGNQLEEIFGSKKFTAIYFVTGIFAALSTLYFNLFASSVGASGAIFGLFGFMIVIQVIASRIQKQPLQPILINFGVFVIMNAVIGAFANADHYAHAGGFVAGALVAASPIVLKTNFKTIRPELILLPVALILFILLPGYQKKYFNTFQHVVRIEQQQPEEGLSDSQYLNYFKTRVSAWDSIKTNLDSLGHVPAKLQEDASKMSKYVQLQKKLNEYRVTMIEKESYIYLDSVDFVQSKMQNVVSGLRFNLYMGDGTSEKPEPAEQSNTSIAKIWYDSNWVETLETEAVYYRVGMKDSIGQWEGQVRDHFINGGIQMKGSFSANKRNGVFIYYHADSTYDAAGRYRNNYRVGRWETYHPNGKLASESFYNERYFYKNSWDVDGTPMVVNGYGKEIQRHPGGAVAMVGEFIDGSASGLWKGYYPNGSLHYEEFYNDGILIRGRSVDEQGRRYEYDASGYFPIPEGGQPALLRYLDAETSKVNTLIEGDVVLVFTVNVDGSISEIIIEKSLSPELDQEAIRILLNGPAWSPGKDHGHLPVPAEARVNIRFLASR